MFKVGDKVRIKDNCDAYSKWCNGKVGVITEGGSSYMVNTYPYPTKQHTSDYDTGYFHLCFMGDELELVE